MASGSFNSSTGVNLNLYCEWSSSANTARNYSDVTMKTYLNHYSLYVGSRSDSYVKCDGQNYTYTAPSISYGGSSKTNTVLLSSKTFRVYHNSDGKKSITLKAGWRFSGTYSGKSIGWITCSKTVTLDNIPRAATINSATNFTSNQNPSLTFSNPGGFSLNVRLEFGGTSIQRNNISNTGSYTFSLSDSERNLLFSKCPNSSTLSVRFVVATKIGSSSETHWAWLDRTMTVQSGNPTVNTFTATRVNNTVPSSWGIYIQGKSQCKLQATASGIYGSSIKSYQIKQGSTILASSSSTTTPVLTSTGTITYTVVVTDSRGRTASKTVSITVAGYSAPYFSSVRSQRCLANGTLNDDGTYIRTLASFTYSKIGQNSVSFTVAFKKPEDENWSAEVASSSGVAKVIAGSASIDSSYQVMFKLVDEFNTVQYIDTLSTAYTTMDFRKGGKGIAIGKVSEYDNLFDVALPSKFRNGLILVDSNGNEIDVLKKIKNL